MCITRWCECVVCCFLNLSALVSQCRFQGNESKCSSLSHKRRLAAVLGIRGMCVCLAQCMCLFTHVQTRFKRMRTPLRSHTCTMHTHTHTNTHPLSAHHSTSMKNHAWRRCYFLKEHPHACLFNAHARTIPRCSRTLRPRSCLTSRAKKTLCKQSPQAVISLHTTTAALSRSSEGRWANKSVAYVCFVSSQMPDSG
jgi:hypothetical protein